MAQARRRQPSFANPLSGFPKLVRLSKLYCQGLVLRCLESRDSNHGSRDSVSLANRIARFEAYLQEEIVKP